MVSRSEPGDCQTDDLNLVPFMGQRVVQVIKHLPRIGKTPFYGWCDHANTTIYWSVLCVMQHSWHLQDSDLFFISLAEEQEKENQLAEDGGNVSED